MHSGIQPQRKLEADTASYEYYEAGTTTLCDGDEIVIGNLRPTYTRIPTGSVGQTNRRRIRRLKKGLADLRKAAAKMLLGGRGGVLPSADDMKNAETLVAAGVSPDLALIGAGGLTQPTAEDDALLALFNLNGENK